VNSKSEFTSNLKIILEGLLVTFLWSTSYILIKLGLQDLPPLTFSAYRYIIASVLLLVASIISGNIKTINIKKHLPKLLFLGFSGYSMAQGLQYVGLFYLPAVTVTFLLNFTPVIVLLLNLLLFRVFPSLFQLVGTGLALFGAYFYFLAPLKFDFLGLLATLFSGLGWASFMIFSRQILEKDEIKPLNLTALSMFFGAIILLSSALIIDGPIVISPDKWVIILWLSLINTALAFVLWNRVLRKIKAFKLTILQNTMLIQIGLLAWIFLSEKLTALKIIGMVMVFIGVLIVQITKR
jgi:drug/metabolite transporter (DMT)-like permease